MRHGWRRKVFEMVDGEVVFKDMDYWQEYVPGPSLIKKDARKEWLDSRPGVIAMIDHIEETVGWDPNWLILDAGCKEGWTSEFLITERGANPRRQMGLELCEEQVEYAHSRNRYWVRQGDVCNMFLFGDGMFDLVLCRHVLGLTKDPFLALKEIFRVTKNGGYIYVLFHIPGNHKKHYCYIPDKKVVNRWLKDPAMNPHVKKFYGANPKRNKHQDPRRTEWVIFLKKGAFDVKKT